MSSSGAGSAEGAPDFGPLAEHYDRLRPPDAAWTELLDVLADEGDLVGRRVLDVGCGTGALAQALAERGGRVWGVEPSAEMLAVARARTNRNVGFKQGRAEALPFKDGWFERAVLRLVVHLVERRTAFAELHRVLAPGGRAVLATFDHAHFRNLWLAPYFPSVATVDAERFPEPARVGRELEDAGFAQVRLRALAQRQTLERDEALSRIRGRFISTLQLLSDDELAEGTARAERELPERVLVELHWAIVAASKP